jgi:hypothetical protein
MTESADAQQQGDGSRTSAGIEMTSIFAAAAKSEQLGKSTSAITPETTTDANSGHDEERPGLNKEQSQLMMNKLRIEERPKLTRSFLIRFCLTFGPIGAGVALYWRGMWTILDLYLYPDDVPKSAWVSLLVGIATGIVVHVISQWVLVPGHFNRSEWKAWQYGIVERAFSFLVAFGAVAYWRGVWYLWDVHVFPNSPEARHWSSMLVGTGILFSLRSFRSTLAPPMVFAPDDADGLDGFALELCDDLWLAEAKIVKSRQVLSMRHADRMVELMGVPSMMFSIPEHKRAASSAF